MGYAARRWPPLLLAVSALLLKVGVDALKPWPMLFLVDHVLQSRPMPGWAQALTGALPGPASQANLCAWSAATTVVLFLLSWTLGLGSSYFGISLGRRAVYDLASDLYAKLQRLSIRFHARKSVGDNIRRVTADCACVSVILKDALLPLLAALAHLVVMITILWRVDPALTLLSLTVVPCMAIVFRRYAQPMLEQSANQQEAEGQIYRVAEEAFAALPLVQAFSAEERNDRRFALANRQTVVATLSLLRLQLWFKILMGLLIALGTAALVYFGTGQALSGRLSLGALLLFLSYLAAFYEPLAALSYTGTILGGAAGSARRVLEVLSAGQDVADRPGAVVLQSLRGHVQFENVSFGYDTGRPVLREVNLEVAPGQCVALVGPTGAGKTTLASLIPRFFDPTQGRVLLDGLDLRGVTLRSLRSQVALAPQDPFLFPMSVAENIAYGRPRASRAEIEAGARVARAHEFILQLPRGYQTVLGDRGANLSLGQRQRLAIARALLKDAPILILDEPTSALDLETERALMDALDALAGQRTVFLIAHRLSTIRKAGLVVALREGRIVELGRPGQLLRAGGYLAGLQSPTS
jgi:ATP-binding cassette, subfamily B, bacterial